MGDELTEEEKAFLNETMQQAKDEKIRRKNRAVWYMYYHRWISTISQILVTLAGSVGLGSLFNLDPNENGFAMLLIVSIISLISGIVLSVMKSLSLDKLASRHKKSASEYSALMTKIAQFMSTPDLSRKDIEIFTTNVTIELSSIESNTQE